MKRNFCIGSEWLYYKIYTGVKTSDIILLEKLYPAILHLKESNNLEKWFFIRYKDPVEHLRIRFFSETPDKILTALYPILNSLLEDDIVWKIEAGTYKREIERYGEKTIVDSETLFWHDSEMIIKYLSLKPFFIKTEIPLLFSCFSIDRFLNSFMLNNAAKMDLMDELQFSFKKEFDADKTLRKEFDKHYRDLWTEIDHFISGKGKNTYPEVFDMVEEKVALTAKTIEIIRKAIETDLSDFLSSHIHMMLNRQYTSNQRMYECLIYDHLFRYYKMNHYQLEKQKHHVMSAF